jgi:hypothetical protein
MLYKQVFKTLEGARKRVAFERAHVRDGQRGNVNYRFFIIRCVVVADYPEGKPDGEPIVAGRRYTYRIEKTLADHPTDPRILSAKDRS